VRDITDRKKVEDTLREQGQLLSKVHDSIISTDLDGKILTWNDAASRMFGYEPGEVIEESIGILYFEEDLSLLADRVINPVKKAGEHSVVIRTRTKEGREIYIDLRLALLRSKDGTPVGMVGCSTDITERRVLQEELLRTATAEQRRIGQELHDTTGQELVGLSYLVRSLAAELPDKDRDGVELVAKIEEGLERAIGQIRSFSRGLIPVEVEANGMMVALSDLVSRMDELNQVECRFHYESPIEIQDNEVATHLYRITQESLTNAIKHAKADKITVRLGAKKGLVSLTVEDDGCGFQETSATEGLGLKIMAYRAELIGARLKIVGVPERGTTVQCTISRDR
jgi:PAS domain S-box-containing protein